MRIYFGGVLFSVIYNMAAGILNAAGNSQRSLIYLGCASITNIILDLVLIAGLRMGVEGAAIATDISQLVSCILSLRFLMRVEDDYRVTLRKIRPDAKMSAAHHPGGPAPRASRTWSSRSPTFWCSPVSTATALSPWQALPRT